MLQQEKRRYRLAFGILGVLLLVLLILNLRIGSVKVPMDELIPNTSDGAFEKHVPDVEVKDGKVYVTVGSTVHPMLENHYITFIALETEKGGQIHYLTPQDEPKAVFDLNGEKPVAVYEYCNLHGFWKKEL